jgi:hypothetical protein
MPQQVSREMHDEAFTEAHASAIFEWETVERKLLYVFSALMRSASPGVSTAISHVVVNLHTRLNMIDAAAKTFLTDSGLSSEWTVLRERVNAMSRHRNRLALSTAVPNMGAKTSPRRRATAFDLATTSAEEVDVRQVGIWHSEFQDLAAELHLFLDRVEAALSR